MNKLSNEHRATILHALVEGNSVNSTARLCGVSKITVLRLLADAGTFCAEYLDLTVRNLTCQRVQVDELWSFVHSKQKNVKFEDMGKGYGDCWTWTAIDADSKLMISYYVGNRSAEVAQDFMDDVASRVTGRPQVTTDTLAAYMKAVVNSFEGDVDGSRAS